MGLGPLSCSTATSVNLAKLVSIRGAFAAKEPNKKVYSGQVWATGLTNAPRQSSGQYDGMPGGRTPEDV